MSCCSRRMNRGPVIMGVLLIFILTISLFAHSHNVIMKTAIGLLPRATQELIVSAVGQWGNIPDWHDHVELNWLRDLIRNKLHTTLASTDVFDLSELYKYKTYVFLGHPEFHMPFDTSHMVYSVLKKEADWMRELMQSEAFLKGLTLPRLESQSNKDIYGRNCSYDPKHEYAYSFSAQRSAGKLVVYVTGRALRPVTAPPNTIMGILKTRNNALISACRLVGLSANRVYQLACPVPDDDHYMVTISASNSIMSDGHCKNDTSVWTLAKLVPANFTAVGSPSAVSGDTTVFRARRPAARLTPCNDARFHEEGAWVHIDGVYHWATWECYYPLVFTDSQLACLKQLGEIMMFGDSHTLRRHAGLVSAYKKRIGLARYYTTRHAINTVCCLLDLYKEYTNANKTGGVLMVNTGHHDLYYLEIWTYIAGMVDVIKLMSRFLALRNGPRVIWVGITAVGTSFNHNDWFNNRILKAADEWVTHQMTLIGVPVVHAYEMSIPVTDHNVGDKLHFPSYLGKFGKPQQKASVGGTIVSVSVHLVCPRN